MKSLFDFKHLELRELVNDKWILKSIHKNYNEGFSAMKKLNTPCKLISIYN